MRATIIGLVLLAAATPATAQGKNDKAKAKALYDSGLNHYNLAEYPDAIKDWKEAYSLSKRPLLLFNIGQAYRLAGDCKMASIFYDNYQREEPNPKNQDELDAAVALCTKALEKPIDKPVDKPTDKPVTTPAETSPVPPPVADRPVEPTTVAAIDAKSPPEEPVDAPATSGGGMRKIGIGVGALGVVLGGVGVYFAMQSASKADELDGFSSEWTDREVAIEADGKSAATRAWIFGAAGVGAIIAGGVMFAIGGPKATETNSVTIVPTRGGAAVGWSARF